MKLTSLALGPAIITSAILALSCSGPSATPVDAPQPGSTTDGSPQPDPVVPPGDVKMAEYGLEHVGISLPGEDICEKAEDGSLRSPIPEGKYKGLLRNAKCEQQKFITMARVAKTMGVQCNHCHVPDPNNKGKEIYPEFTDNKRKANWMFKTFIQGLRPTNGDKMMCKSCHTDRASGKGLIKILKEPRDRDFAQEWMHEVMTTKFVEKNGKRLKCKTCHVGLAPDTDGWIKDVIRRLTYKDSVQRREDLANDSGE
jgi:hypothetical protein